MRHSKILLQLSVLFAVLLSISGCRAANDTTALDAYVKAPDPSYQWKDGGMRDGAAVLNLTSQTWHKYVWKHQLVIVQPIRDKFPGTALLLVNMGKRPEELQVLRLLANGCGCTVVGLSDIPNQPIWGHSEDSLIAYTFQQFLQTGDKTWPLLLPMTKSVVKAMDAVQDYTKSSPTPITKFIVGGASKRGWTTWLTAAEDSRVIGIVPMVYDNLDIPKQLPHQKEMLGDYSSQISDYTRLDLPKQLATAAGKELVQTVDPYFYRDRITVPKLIINAANDPYWTVDSLNLYYDDLKGPKNVFYIPNAGHSMNLEKGLSGVLYLLGSVEGWVRTVASGKTPPTPHLKVKNTEDGKQFSVRVAGATAGELWVATSATRDFRRSEWTAQPLKNADGNFEGDVKTPKTGYVAVFAQLTLSNDASTAMRLSTPMTWWGKQ